MKGRVKQCAVFDVSLASFLECWLHEGMKQEWQVFFHLPCLHFTEQLNTKAAFTRQTNVGQLVLANSNWCVWTAQQHVGKLLATNRTCLYSRQQFANVLWRRSHTPIWVCQHELANISLTFEGRLSRVTLRLTSSLRSRSMGFSVIQVR